MSDPTYRLLLQLAGRVDDDLLATGRELVAVGEEGHALELLVAELVAGRVELPGTVRLELVAEAAARRVQPDADHCPQRGPGGDPEHRFTGSGPGGPEIAAAVAAVPELGDGALAWRTTPAGAAPGALPHPVLLARTGDGGSAEVVAYQGQAALARAGLVASVEVQGDDDPDPAYHRAARTASVPVRSLVPRDDRGADRAAPGDGAVGVPDRSESTSRHGSGGPGGVAGRDALHAVRGASPGGPTAALGLPTDGFRTGDRPTETPPAGAAPTGPSPNGASPTGSAPTNAAPTDRRPNGAAPTDRPPDGAGSATADTPPSGSAASRPPAGRPGTGPSRPDPAASGPPAGNPPPGPSGGGPAPVRTGASPTGPADRPTGRHETAGGLVTRTDPGPGPGAGPAGQPGPAPDRASEPRPGPSPSTSPSTGISGSGPSAAVEPAPGSRPVPHAGSPDIGPTPGGAPSPADRSSAGGRPGAHPSPGDRPAPGAPASPQVRPAPVFEPATDPEPSTGSAPPPVVGSPAGPEPSGTGPPPVARPTAAPPPTTPGSSITEPVPAPAPGTPGPGPVGDLPASTGAGPAPGAGTFDDGPVTRPVPAPDQHSDDGDPVHPAPRPSPPIRALRDATTPPASEWFGDPAPTGTPSGNGTPSGPPTPDEDAWTRDWASGAWAGDVLAGPGDGPPHDADTGGRPNPQGAAADVPTPPPGVAIVSAPVPPPGDLDGSRRPRHLLVEETTGPARADDGAGPAAAVPAEPPDGTPAGRTTPPAAQPRPSPDALADRLSPTEQDLLARLHEELDAREGGSEPAPRNEPTPRNGTARRPRPGPA